jgi:primosomal protein N' (replication factor Y)
VAGVKPLRLKSEVIVAKPEQSTSAQSVASIWVDSSVYHLDTPFDYLIPDNLSPLVSVGTRVQVPFHGRELEGLVLDRRKNLNEAGLKVVTKVLSPNSVATIETISLIKRVAQRWAAHPYDVVRFAIPPQVASIDREIFQPIRIETRKYSHKSRYIQLPAHRDPIQYVVESLLEKKFAGTTLVVAPETISVERLATLLPESITLESSLEKGARYLNFLKIRNGNPRFVIGTRSAIFAPVNNLENIVVIDEGSEHHYEDRAPGWNTRDVAIMRYEESNCNLIFFGYSPSSEIASLIDSSEIFFQKSASKVDVRTFAPYQGELIPSRLVALMRSKISDGSILVLTHRKGYAQALSCSQCRNIALCECGGKLRQISQKSGISCSLCNRSHSEFICAWCSSQTPYFLSTGSDRYAYEIGALIPGTPIVQSNADHRVVEAPINHSIIISTAGLAPLSHEGFSLVVILDAETYFSESDMRAAERARQLLFATAAHVSKKGTVALVAKNELPIVAALASWKPSLLSVRELRERAELLFPPYSRSVTLDIDTAEAQTLKKALTKAIEENRLPMLSRILGPSQLKPGVDRIVILAPIDVGDSLSTLLHEFQRRRSASKKVLASIRIDPYSLSR